MQRIEPRRQHERLRLGHQRSIRAKPPSRVTPIACSVCAEVDPPRAARLAMPAGDVGVGRDPVADAARRAHRAPDCLDDAAELVPQRHRQRRRIFAAEHVPVRTADARRLDAHDEIVRSGHRPRHILERHACPAGAIAPLSSPSPACSCRSSRTRMPAGAPSGASVPARAFSPCLVLRHCARHDRPRQRLARRHQALGPSRCRSAKPSSPSARWSGSSLLVLYIRKWIVAPAAATRRARRPGAVLLHRPDRRRRHARCGAASCLTRCRSPPSLFSLGALYTLAFGLWRTGLILRGSRAPATTTPVLYLPLVAGSFVLANCLVAVRPARLGPARLRRRLLHLARHRVRAAPPALHRRAAGRTAAPNARHPARAARRRRARLCQRLGHRRRHASSTPCSATPSSRRC